MTQVFSRAVECPAPAAEVFAWHERPGAFQRLMPPWDPVEIVQAPPDLHDGSRGVLRVRLGGLPVTWQVEHRDYVPGVSFRDVQLRGPFAAWAHTHRVTPLDARRSTLHDRIEYRLPFGALGQWLGGGMVRRKLARLFDHRHRLMNDDLRAHTGLPKLNIAVGGAGGLIGGALLPFLTTGGHTVRRLVRRAPRDVNEVRWQAPDHLDAAGLEGLDAVIHLAGEPILGRWTPAKKEVIRSSRVEGTRQLCEALAGLKDKPRTLLSASAIGIYGDRGDEVVDENSAPGTDFLGEVCAAWEAACAPARDAGIRVVNLRIGVVLSAQGGALAKMRPAFAMGAGGPIGPGTQWMSWIALDDVLGAIAHCLAHSSIEGPINLVAPRAVTNRDFARTLGHVLHRPSFLPAPSFALRALFGEAANAVLLAGQRVRPKVLEETGYAFRHADLEGALRAELGR